MVLCSNASAPTFKQRHQYFFHTILMTRLPCTRMKPKYCRKLRWPLSFLFPFQNVSWRNDRFTVNLRPARQKFKSPCLCSTYSIRRDIVANGGAGKLPDAIYQALHAVCCGCLSMGFGEYATFRCSYNSSRQHQPMT
jgi:hypothetical protein